LVSLPLAHGVPRKLPVPEDLTSQATGRQFKTYPWKSTRPCRPRKSAERNRAWNHGAKQADF